MFSDETAEGEQQPGEERQAVRHVFVDLREARHDVEHEEAEHQRADDHQDRRVDACRDDLLLHAVELFLVGDIARQRFLDVAGALARLDRRHVERREMLREAGHRLRERLAAVDRGEHAGEHLASLARCLFLVQRLQRFHQVEAGVEQRAQLDREERRAKRAFLREARLPVPAGGGDAEDREPAAAGDVARRRFACGVEAERNDLLRAIEGVEVEPHYRLSVTCCARPMSASSPLPPGLPSRPSE